MSNQEDNKYMLMAIKLAKKAWYTTDPNPRVGCVIVKNNQVIGQGWHERAGQPHAEVHALNDAGNEALNATAYVTLEPCSHFGKTPPCCEALINANVARVVVAMQDPNPLVSGNGIKRLKESGIKVKVGVLEEEAQALNPAFLHKMRTGKAFVCCKMAMSLDGRTAMASGESQWITSANSRRDVQRLRAESSAILMGINTVLDDDPSMNVRDEQYIQAKQPQKIILDSALRIPLESKVLAEPSLVTIFTSEQSLKKFEASKLQSMGINIIAVDKTDEGLNLLQVMQEIATLPLNNILVETGKKLSGALLAAGLIDELIIYIAPMLMGNNARGLFDLPQLESLNDAVKLKLIDIRQVGEDFRVRAKIIND